ncbi:hypothetical protein D1007_29228 [Hordeum vulgare]|nr:hypothetical protein D1007_29228 [Hordeum vulgare]
MHDFSPPSLAVTLLLTLLRWDVLVHLDCVEDWMRPSPRSSHSRQSGLPSSDDDDDRPFPRRLATGNWLHGMEDGCSGGGVADPRAKELACVASSGCRGVPSSRARWEHSENDRDGHKRSWKGVLLGRSHDKEAATAGSSSERHKSQAPTSWLRQGDRALPAPTCTDPHAISLEALAAAKTSKPLYFIGDEDEGNRGEHTLDLGADALPG